MSTSMTKEIQEKELTMLLYFKEFCDKHYLRFYLCGGGLIGAIRHNGFIPWDDDLDLFMPRPDYEKLAELWPKYADTERYTYCRTDRHHIYHDAGASIRDNNTTFINRHSMHEDICHGLALEIMPIDGCAPGKISRALQLMWAMTFALFNAQRLPDNKGPMYRALAGCIYKVFSSQSVRYHIWRFAEKQMTKYDFNTSKECTELIGSLKGMKLRHPQEDFASVVYKDFEGHQIPVMKGYERYLRLIWGDYMQLPPVEQRVAKHDAAFADLHTPYKEYRGIYYAQNKAQP
ncbi:LicD family protein [Veillonella rogosae]|uniref:LicD family protein n=1 Tax=Veillonella rogosae TaxID=423477 RepID=A0AA47AH41_9FIRM|nr:LicD family protein [Veillonella rogosae]MDU1973254.1 LicD family protein [Veillonella sp.]UZG50281.1 LicD family protein [Veillonella rogosae]